MLNKNRSRSTGLWKYGFSAPLFMLMLIVSAATVKSDEGSIKPVAEALLSPLGPETSKTIISALELNNPTPQLEENTTYPPVVTLSNETNTSSTEPDYTELRKHFQRTMKYPASAKQNKITGLVVANFMIKDKKVTSIMIEKGVQQDIDDEVIRTLTLYKDDIDAPDDKYSIAVSFHLLGPDAPTELAPYVGVKNYVGQIRVTGYLPEANLKNNDIITGVSPNNSLKLKEVVISSDETVKDFASVEVLPEFPGGLEGWTKYLQSNLKYPKLARDNNILGRVILSFIVEKDGSLSDIKVLRGLGSGTDEEAIRVLKSGPNWKPGIQNGQPVRVAYTMPIFFQLANNQNTTGNTNGEKPAKPTLPPDVKDFSSVEMLPEFPGGQVAWGKYITANLKYPEQAKKENINGRVIMSFIVEKDGSLSDVKVLRGLGGGTDEEALRVLKNSPKWKPGKILDGSLVRVAYTMPIFFKLGSE